MKHLAALTALLLAATSAAQARPVVVELFTSEACSSCPPAEAFLGQLAQNPKILALAFHITYWNGPAWTDQYALTAATDRQTTYATLLHESDVFTPQAIIDGQTSATGSDQPAVTAAIVAAQAAQPPEIPIIITPGKLLTIKIGPGTATAQIWLFGYDLHHTTQIGGGENAGATINETNIVRSITPLGLTTGIPVTYTIPTPTGQHMAVLVQTETGAILGAATN